MSPFRVLGLDRNADESAIKRAYAKLLKTTRPDDDPAGFQRLNDAYRAALAQAAHTPSRRQKKPELSQSGDLQPMFSVNLRYEGGKQATMEPPPVPAPALSYEPAPATAPLISSPVALTPRFDAANFTHRLHEFAMRHEAPAIRQWLLADPDLFSIGLKARLAPQLVDALLHHTPLPPPKLDAVLGFFDLNQVVPSHPGLKPHILQLQQLSRAAFPLIEDVKFRPRPREKEYSFLPHYILAGLLVLVVLWSFFSAVVYR